MTQLTLHGEVITWNISTNEVPFATVRNALQKALLDPDIAKEMSNSSAFSRATATLKENRSIDKVKRTKDGKTTFQLTRKALENDRMRFDYEAQVILDNETGDITCTDPEIERQATELVVHAMCHRTAADITRFVQKLFRDNADLFPINPQKGVAYFVPDRFRDFTAKVEQFLGDCGGSIERWPVPAGDSNGDKSVAKAISSGLDAMIQEMDQTIEDWSDTTRKSTMKKTIERVEVIEHKMRAYQDYIGKFSHKLEDAIEKSKSRLLDKVTELQSKTADSTAA